MNRVPLARRVQVINCLVEGNSIRSTERMTGTHRDTICRLLVEVGDGCAKLMDEQMHELSCRRIEVDEIWAYVGKKQRHMTEDDDPRRVGDQYTFVALDIPSLPSMPRRSSFRPISSASVISRPRLRSSRTCRSGWRTVCSYRQTLLRRMSRQPSGRSVRISTTANT
jgi:hypothetical protein